MVKRQKHKFNVTKQKFLLGFIIVTLVLAGVKSLFIHPSTAQTTIAQAQSDQAKNIQEETTKDTSIQSSACVSSRFFDKKHPIISVRSFKEEFPDTNDLQLTAAEKYGVQPVANRADAERRKGELVYVGSNPYYEIKPLTSSIPYLVPRAALLLQDIGKNFFDSLQIKHIPLHRIMVSSVLRTKEDVEKLRKHNRNATEKSCHLYGTTFDISHTKFLTVSDPAGPARRQVRDDTLKFVLSEVLRDLRNQQRCYIKYEVKQACFHITVR